MVVDICSAFPNIHLAIFIGNLSRQIAGTKAPRRDADSNLNWLMLHCAHP